LIARSVARELVTVEDIVELDLNDEAVDARRAVQPICWCAAPNSAARSLPRWKRKVQPR
jgi:hypothetical protein